MAQIAPILSVVASVVSTVIQATSKPNIPPPPTEQRLADPGHEGAIAAARASESRRRRLAQGRPGTITGAGSGLLSDGGALGSGQAPATPTASY